MKANGRETPGTHAARWSTRSNWFGLGVLFLVSLSNYVDRSIISIMQEPLRQDLGLNDTELGAVTGLAFAIFYTIGGIPIARLADRFARKYVLAVSLTIWALMTAASGGAIGFATMLVFRVGVALGEAGCSPATLSMISDLFPRRQRTLAMSFWGLSMPVGTMLGIYLGGHLTVAVGWRTTFLITGLSGLALTPLILVFLEEPTRGGLDGASGCVAEAPPRPLGRSIAILWNLRSFRYLCMAAGLQTWAQSAMMAWNAPFYGRVHHVPLQHLATALSLIMGLGGTIGILLGGALASALGKNDTRWFMRVPAAAAALTIPFALLQYLASGSALSLAAATIPGAMTFVFIAPANAISQSLVRADMRALTASVFVFVVSLIGAGFGPIMIGALSDTLRGHVTGEPLRYALLAVVIPLAAACWLFLRAGLYLPSELESRGGS